MEVEKGGVLKHGHTDLRRLGVVVAAAATMAAGSIALLSSGGAPLSLAAGAHDSQRTSAAASAQALANIQSVADKLAAPVTTTTAAPAPVTTTTAAPVPTTTTTTAPRVVAPAPTTTVPAQVNSVQGVGTWYDWNAGQCASPTLPHGTQVRITNLDNGASVTCLITDTEASGWPRVIDMDRSIFEQIAGPQGTSVGVLNVSVSW
jgi:rare lipoprotein A (peptidoglycan hydrolase)